MASPGGGIPPVLPREPMALQPWTLSLHLPAAAARLAAMDPKVRSLEEDPGIRLSPRMEVQFVRLPSPMTLDLLEGLSFTRGDGAELWTPATASFVGRVPAAPGL